MAVTAGQEYGLFIGGEVVEPASGEVRDLHEPATGEPLARAAMAGEADIDRAGAFYAPTLLAGVETSMTVAPEEIFGPVVVAIPFEDEKDAIRIANDVQYGLFATVWTGDPARGHRVARAVKSGMVGINMPFTAFPGAPFGGYKQSGFGRELSIDTLDLYRHARPLSRNEGRALLDEPEALQPLRPLATS